MKCPGCDRELKRREDSQAMNLLGHTFTVRAFCDECCRAGTPTPGNGAALERLYAGTFDEDERARVRAATPSPWDTPPTRIP